MAEEVKGRVRDLSDKRLSYSSGEIVANCPQKYIYKKVLNVPFDSDADTSTRALDVGLAIHKVQELCGHDKKPEIKHVMRALKTYKLDSEDFCYIYAMSLKYHKLHIASGLKTVVQEQEIGNDIFLGYIDLIMKDPKTKEWWIGDIKTASELRETKIAMLKSDTQLNLYAKFKDVISKSFNLDVSKFAGVRYRVVVKPKLKRKNLETNKEYIRRLFKATSCYDYIVPRSDLNWRYAYEHHKSLQSYAEALKHEKRGMRNYNYCNAFFKPCEYWSKCHGAEYTKSKQALQFIKV